MAAAEQVAPALLDNISEESEVIEQATRKEKLAQRIEWENYVFQPFETDQEVIERYLQNLFGKEINEQAFKALEALRASVEALEASLAAPSQFNNTTLKWIIEGLLGSDLLTGEKRAVLKDFISNIVILSEVADVLNMRMTALLNWGWGGDIAIGQRRHLNGEYRVYIARGCAPSNILTVNWGEMVGLLQTYFRYICQVGRSLDPTAKAYPKAG
jgi:hypothetical protein